MEERLRRMNAAADRVYALVKDGGPPPDHGEMLYDEKGLPK